MSPPLAADGDSDCDFELDSLEWSCSYATLRKCYDGVFRDLHVNSKAFSNSNHGRARVQMSLDD